jgi:hypothetical protein
LLNAAASLAIANDLRFADAAALATKLVDAGKARARLHRWLAASRAQQPMD